ncbi:MAG: hypothetical protein KC425_27895, partial [Anaerolineales bacterium]|nr:hypothetical protein [Anaerolineales bacterium]
YTPPAPRFTGVRVFGGYGLAQLRAYIEWEPCLRTWELAGKFPHILQDAVVGETAAQLHRDAEAMLDCLVQERWLTARGVLGFFPAHAAGDDVLLFADAARQQELARLHFLRQQMERPPGRPNRCLADYVAPCDTGPADYVGLFAVTTGIGIERKLAEFEAAHDDYHAILLQALADRLAEAFAERLHARVRREFWGYAPDEALDNEALIAERYRGIRPAPGYPACPDHTEKETIFRLLDAPGNAGMSLTESYAMYPAAAVSGYYFAHPEARYFGLGRIAPDQVADYAARKGWDVETAARWLAPNLAG